MSETFNQSSAARSAQDEDSTKYLPFPPVVLAIAGCSGSGKTTLAAELARTLVGVHFHFDNYYRDLAAMPLADRAEQNFDDPALIESPLLIAHVAALARGEAIERPLYDFSRYIRISGRTETFRPGPYLLVEGLFALYFAQLLPLYQLRAYIDTPDELCFERRLKRDLDVGRHANFGIRVGPREKGGSLAHHSRAARASQTRADSADMARADFLPPQNRVGRLADRKPCPHVARAKRIRRPAHGSSQDAAFGVGQDALRFRAATIEPEEVRSIRTSNVVWHQSSPGGEKQTACGGAHSR